MKYIVAKLTILVFSMGLLAGCGHFKGNHSHGGAGCGCEAGSKEAAHTCAHKKAEGDSDKECKDCKK